MTADTLHTCSYACERPGCIRAQRDYLRDKLEAITAEIERLRSIISDLKDWDCDVRGGFLSIPVDLRRRIHDALAAQHQEPTI